jgi:hypothetical protein
MFCEVRVKMFELTLPGIIYLRPGHLNATLVAATRASPPTAPSSARTADANHVGQRNGEVVPASH